MEYGALAVSVITLLVLLADRIFGGGRGLANQFASLSEKLTAAITKVELDFVRKREDSERNIGEAINGFRNQMHALEKAQLEFRAFVAETYMRRDSYYKANEELKGDIKDGFDRVEKRLDRMEKSAGHNGD